VAPSRLWAASGARASRCEGRRGGAARLHKEEWQGRTRKKTDTRVIVVTGRKKTEGVAHSPYHTTGRRDRRVLI
jgi:hypothetical protein